jgi:5-methylcytosine-specific restriction endonuclease McrA
VAPVGCPLCAARYKLQFTVSRETHDKLRRAQDLLRHSIPHGDPAAVFDRALTLLLEHLERTKLAQAKTPRQVSRPTAPGSRYIPASVRRAVWARDGGRCAFEGTEGRCGATAFLEFHHVIPFARGGLATVDNVQLRCRAHNQHEAVEEFGERALFIREMPPAYVVNPVRTELLVSCAAWPIIQGSSGRNPRGTRRSAARRFPPAATAAMRSG